MAQLFNGIGLCGVALELAAFFLLQSGRLSERDRVYLTLNLAGSLALLVSLAKFWNLPAVILNAAWALISMYGLLSSRRKTL